MEPIVAKALERREVAEKKAEQAREEMNRWLAEVEEIDVFLKMAKSLKAEIASGEVIEGTKIPSKRELITNFALALIEARGPQTARRILEEIDRVKKGDWVSGRNDRMRISNVSSLMARDQRFGSTSNGYVVVVKQTPLDGGNQQGASVQH